MRCEQLTANHTTLAEHTTINWNFASLRNTIQLFRTLFNSIHCSQRSPQGSPPGLPFQSTLRDRRNRRTDQPLRSASASRSRAADFTVLAAPFADRLFCGSRIAITIIERPQVLRRPIVCSGLNVQQVLIAMHSIATRVTQIRPISLSCRSHFSPLPSTVQTFQYLSLRRHLHEFCLYIVRLYNILNVLRKLTNLANVGDVEAEEENNRFINIASESEQCGEQLRGNVRSVC